jgi:glycosyltransferase involved in cell wall biosynthesis
VTSLATQTGQHPSEHTGARVRTIVGVRSCDCGIQGPENLILTLAANMRERHVRYVVVNLWDGDPPRVALHEEALRRGLESHVVASSSDLDPAVLPRLAVLLRRLRPDVIHTHDFKSEIITLAANCVARAPVVSSFYGRLAINSLLLRAEDWTRMLVLRCFQRVLANSEAQRVELLRWRLPASKVGLLPSFVDTGAIRPATAAERAAARRRLDIADDQPVIATVARLSQNKGHRAMIAGMPALLRRYPRLLYLVPGEGDSAWHGDGGFRALLERYATELGVSAHVRFLGYYPDLAAILAATDVIVSPSLREGMQVSLLEAMAAGKAVVATRVGGTPDAVIHGETGLLVPPDEPAALAESVAALFGDRRRMLAMGAAGRRRVVEHFDTRVVVERMLGVCEQVLGYA